MQLDELSILFRSSKLRYSALYLHSTISLSPFTSAVFKSCENGSPHACSLRIFACTSALRERRQLPEYSDDHNKLPMRVNFCSFPTPSPRTAASINSTLLHFAVFYLISVSCSI